jgi:hypothetical protein
MSNIKYDPDAEHAVHFDRDYHYVFGHVQSMKIGDVTLTADLNMLEPKFQNSVVVAGLVSLIEWGGGPEDTLTLDLFVSTKNRQLVTNIVHKNVSDVEVKVKFVIYDYDPQAKKWFNAFYTNDQEISGSIEQQGGSLDGGRVKLELSVSSTMAKHSDGHDLSPSLWEVKTKIKPGNTVQSIHFLTSSLHKIVKEWGVPAE